MTDAPVLTEREQLAWLPVLAFAYAAVAASVLSFLAAGFGSVQSLERALGSIVPDPSLHAIVGNLVALVLATGCAYPAARRALCSMPTGESVARRSGTLLLIALLLALPPVRTMTFGAAPASGSVAQHAGMAMDTAHG